jgi:hypothetical protein
MIKFLGKTYAQTRTAAENGADLFLDQLTGAQLVELHNLVRSNLGLSTTKRFADTKTAIKRTWAALEAYDQANDESLGADDKGKTAPAPKDEKRTRKPRGMRFVFPAGDEIKAVRPGTFRAKLVELFSTKPGATFDEALAATWGSKKGMDPEVAKKTCYEGIRLLHYYVGYGMKQDADGRITIHK